MKQQLFHFFFCPNGSCFQKSFVTLWPNYKYDCMSKANVKKYIKSLDKSSLEELVMDLYSARKEAKDYMEYVNDEGKLEEYRDIITKEFFPSRGEFLCMQESCI